MPKKQSKTLFDYTADEPDNNSNRSSEDKRKSKAEITKNTESENDPENDPPSNDSPPTGGDDSLCPCYTEELKKCQASVDDRVINKLNINELKCGHAIDYIIDAVGATLTEGSCETYASQLRGYINYLQDQGIIVCEATFRDVDKFFKHLARINRSEKTLNLTRTAITNLYKHVALYRDAEANVRWDLIREEINPSDYQTPEARERVNLEKTEVKKLYDSMQCFRDRVLTQVGVELGPRNTDLCSIMIEDVDLDKKEIKLANTKAGGSYTLPITHELALLLRRWIEIERSSYPGSSNNDYLFPSRNGGKLSSSRLCAIVREAAERAGIQETEKSEAPLTKRQKIMFNTEKDYKVYHKVTPHTLRHTFHHLLKEAGLPHEARSRAMDHESTDVTKEFYDHDESNFAELMRDLFSGGSIDLSSKEE